MNYHFILAAVISTVVAIPLPDVQSQQQQWGDDATPFLLSTPPNDQLIASNPQNDAQTGFEQTNAVEPSMPFAMDLEQIAVGGGGPSILSKEVVNPSTSFDVASTIPSTDLGLTQEFSGSLGSNANTGTEPAAGLTPGSSTSPALAAAPGSEVPPAPGSTLDAAWLNSGSSPSPAPGSTLDAAGLTPGSSPSPALVAAPGSEVPPAPGSTLYQAPLDMNSLFETTGTDDDQI